MITLEQALIRLESLTDPAGRNGPDMVTAEDLDAIRAVLRFVQGLSLAARFGPDAWRCASCLTLCSGEERACPRCP